MSEERVAYGEVVPQEQGNVIRDERRHSFFIVDNELIDTYGPKIGTHGIAVYCALARYANERGEGAYPSYQTLARNLGLSRPTVIKVVSFLIDHGLVTKTERFSDEGNRSSNTYALTPMDKGGGKRALLGVVNVVNQGGKRALPDQDSIKKTPLEKDIAPNGASVPEKQEQIPMFDEMSAQDTPVAGAEKPKPARKAKKKSEAYVHPVTGVSTADITNEYVKCMEENEPGSAVSYPRESKGALILAQNGWTPQTVRECYLRMKQEDFWRRKHLSLHSVANTIGSMMGAPPSTLPEGKPAGHNGNMVLAEVRLEPDIYSPEGRTIISKMTRREATQLGCRIVSAAP